MTLRQTKDPEKLNQIATEIRKSVIQSLTEAGSGHLGGSLGLADVFTVLYFSVLHHNPLDPKWPDRDRLILSIGHVAPVLYATLAHAGYFPLVELHSLRKLGSRLQGHPGREHGLPGLELSAGSLGQGLSVAVGMAIAGKLDLRMHKIYAILGDGELQEGSVWESAMAAAHHHLNNLIVIVDRNGVQIDGKTEDVMRLEPLEEKWKSFGWQVECCDGNNTGQLLEAFNKVYGIIDKPSVIIAHTRMGKGIKSIEGNFHWHGKVPDPDQAKEFLRELSGIEQTVDEASGNKI
ncbi:MAG: transketolase [Bacteroidales bacterium]|jgi:transketolase|nr:transketolase [Bacteroidales bacterium]